MDIRNVLHVVLKDDSTPYGGITFQGETVSDFIIEMGMDENTLTIEELNEALGQCGIKQIEPEPATRNSIKEFGSPTASEAAIRLGAQELSKCVDQTTPKRKHTYYR